MGRDSQALIPAPFCPRWSRRNAVPCSLDNGDNSPSSFGAAALRRSIELMNEFLFFVKNTSFVHRPCRGNNDRTIRSQPVSKQSVLLNSNHRIAWHTEFFFLSRFSTSDWAVRLLKWAVKVLRLSGMALADSHQYSYN